MAANYELWGVARLKENLVKRGATTRGRKTDLVERLKAYDRNEDFRNEPIIMPDPLQPNWPTHGFQQLNPMHKILMPKITKEQVTGYFIYRLAGDQEASSDIKALTKGEKMVESRILACSFQSSDHIFFSGIVGAAMKNKVTYNYKIKLTKETGEPVNSHCECPAGKGPHGTCKHIAAVLLMLVEFVESGQIDVERSCTDNLQTFHKPKNAYNGSPRKAEALPSKRKFAKSMLDDPRPKKYRGMEGYNDHVRNVMVNFCSRSSLDVALRYNYSKADIQSASNDHDYCQHPFLEYWIDQSVTITDQQARAIESATRNQSQCSKWYKERKYRLTASNFGQIAKMTDRRNKVKLCKSLYETVPSTKAMLHGKQYESKAIKMFEKKYELKCKKCGLFIRPDLPFLGATPDGIIDDDTLIEVKCPYTGRQKPIVPGKCFPFLGYDSQGAVVLKQTSNYYYQIQGQLYIAQRKKCYFIVYTFKDLFVQVINVDREYCKFSLIPKLDLFFETHYKPFLASKI